MRSMIAPVLAIALTASGAFAADNAPLPAGKPAGVKNADMEGHGVLILVGVGLIAAGIAIAISSGSGNGVTTTTSSTAP